MSEHFRDDQVVLHLGDSLEVLRTLPDASVDCCVTSPPYFGLRDYGIEGQYGLEASPAEYVETMRGLFAEVHRVLADNGTLWLNLGDSYANPTGSGEQGQSGQRSDRAFTASGVGGCVWLPAKNLMGVPWRVAFALQEDGWILRNEIIWNKPNAMPESVTDRLASRHEHLFLFSKRPKYWFDLDPIREPQSEATEKRLAAGPVGIRRDQSPGETRDRSMVSEVTKGKNPGDVWAITTRPFTEAHFAVMPPELAERCILAGCQPGGTVLDPFSGSGTTGMVAQRHGRKYVGIDLNKDYLDLSLRTRLQQSALDFTEESAS